MSATVIGKARSALAAQKTVSLFQARVMLSWLVTATNELIITSKMAIHKTTVYR